MISNHVIPYASIFNNHVQHFQYLYAKFSPLALAYLQQLEKFQHHVATNKDKSSLL